MRTLVVETTEGIELRHELAGAGSRFAAGALDASLFMLVWSLILVAAAWIAAYDPTGQMGFVAGLAGGGALLGLVGFHVVFGILWQGQSPGKRALGLRIASGDGSPPTSQQILLRSLFWPLEAALVLSPVPIALILITLGDRAQRLGDLVAGTLVVREPEPRVDAEPFARDSFDGLPVKRLALVPALAARVDDEAFELLRDVLARGSLNLRVRKQLFDRTAAHFGQLLEIDLGEDSAGALRELYLYLRERPRWNRGTS